jgi:hypothetical protein
MEKQSMIIYQNLYLKSPSALPKEYNVLLSQIEWMNFFRHDELM